MITRFSKNIPITRDDIDHMGHVNNVVYVRWIQEVAEAHWTAAAPKEYQQKYRWVVLRHEIDYLKAAMPGDQITGQTWIESLEGAKSIRIVEIIKEDTVLARACTIWVMLDAHTGRPTRIGEEMKQHFFE